MQNESIDKNQIPSNATETKTIESASPSDIAKVLSDSELDGVSGGAVYMKVDWIVKEDDSKVVTPRVQP